MTLSGAVAEAVSVTALVVVLAWAVVRPRGWPEAVVAIPAAVALVAAGALPGAAAAAELRRLGPVVLFLAAVLVLAGLCDKAGLFRACGEWMARLSGGSAERLLVMVFAVAAMTTPVLSLDATVVLLTPVVFATAARVGARPRPHVYACTHLANSASVLLPVSNLTNLLAFAASGLGFGRFAALMTLPWLVVIAVEYAVFRWYFAADLGAGARGLPAGPGADVPVFALAVLGGTLAGFAVTSAAGLSPAWSAFGGAAVLAARSLAGRMVTVADVVRSAAVPFGVFVLALGVIVTAVVGNGLGGAVASFVPQGPGLAAVLARAAIAAVLANLINHLPAVLVLLPLAAPSGAGAVLAVLLGVNIGPNLTYTGSLATMLWRRVMHQHGPGPSLREFTVLGILAVPAGLALAVLALWAGLHVIGG